MGPRLTTAALRPLPVNQSGEFVTINGVRHVTSSTRVLPARQRSKFLLDAGYLSLQNTADKASE